MYCMLKKKQTPCGCVISSHAQSPSSTQALSYIDFACAASCFGKTTGAGIERRGIFRQLKRNRTPIRVSYSFLESGSCLSSHAVASTVLSVYKGLTSVFGMRTGGTP